MRIRPALLLPLSALTWNPIMKSLVKSGIVASLAILLANGSAFAGDYNSGIVTKAPSAGYTNVEFGSGWYLRGDIGYSASQSLDVSFARDARGGDAGASLDNTYSASVGAGYIFNDYLRADATFDIFSSRDWSGSGSGCGLDGLGVPHTGDCTSTDTGSFEAHALSMNAYVNLGQWGRVSPYVGAGVGLAHVEYGATNSALNCVVDPGETCDLGVHSGGTANPETFTGTQQFESGSSVNLTYALMLGMDYRIDKNWSADLGYRYTNITGSETFSDSASADQIEFSGAEIHEVRGGLRYDLW